MEAEIEGLLKAFISSAKQYFSCQNEPNFLTFQRNLEVITGLSVHHEIFDPEKFAVNDCFSCLVDIIIHQNHKMFLLEKTLLIFQNLAKNGTVLKVLQSNFNLHIALTMFLEQYGIILSDPWVSKCIELLEVVTEDVHISYVDHHLEYLITSLLGEINNKSSDVYVRVLHIICNLTRQNPKVQEYVCRLQNFKQILKSVISKLSCSIPAAVIYSLSILANLMVMTHLGEKVFTVKHVMEALSLITTVLTSKEEASSSAALNLFLDIAKMPHMLQHYVRYEQLDSALQTVISAYSSDTPASLSSRYLRFLWVFANLCESKQTVVDALLVAKPVDDNNTVVKSFHPILKKYSCGDYEEAGDAAFYALKIIRVMIKYFVEEEFHCIEADLYDLAESLARHVMMPYECKHVFLKQTQSLQVELFELLFVLCEQEGLKNVISKHLDMEDCRDLIFTQLQHNILSYTDDGLSESGVDLLLALASLLSAVSNFLPPAEELLEKFFQDPRVTSFIAFSVSSASHESVRRALYLITVSKERFPLTLLSKSISFANRKHHQAVFSREEMSADTDGLVTGTPVSVRGRPLFRKSSLERKVEALIKKIENGLELQQLKASEILDLYEHEITTLSMREKELDTLAHAKSLALQQADRVLNHYKCRQAQMDLETKKLRTVLKESEKRSEISTEQCADALEKLALVRKELNSREKDLTYAIKQIEDKSATIAELNDRICQLTEDREKDNKSFVKQLKEKDASIKEMKNKVDSLEDLLKKSEEKCENLENFKLSLQKDIELMEKAMEKQKQEAKLLEMVCQQHEASIREKDSKIKKISEELESLKSLFSKIREISTGEHVVSLLKD